MTGILIVTYMYRSRLTYLSYRFIRCPIIRRENRYKRMTIFPTRYYNDQCCAIISVCSMITTLERKVYINKKERSNFYKIIGVPNSLSSFVFLM